MFRFNDVLHRDDSRVGQRRPNVVGERYELEEPLGKGAYGEVFKAKDLQTGDYVAIKQIPILGVGQERLPDIMGEIDLLKNLDHENIVKYVGSYRTRTHLFIVLEFMEQGALSQLIKKERAGALPEPTISAFVTQVLRGLDYLHAQGVVHRDIKGANILLGAQGQVKLADFGVATQGEADNGSGIDPVGTPYWMAPEVIEMIGSTAPSDIWSVGCLIIELFTGSPPYFEHQPMSALYRIVSDPEVPLPEGITRELRAFLKRCFHKDPQDRPAAGELLRDPWLTASQRTLRNSWRRAATLATSAAGAGRSDVDQAMVRTVVARYLDPSRRSSMPLKDVAQMIERMPGGAGEEDAALPPKPPRQAGPGGGEGGAAEQSKATDAVAADVNAVPEQRASTSSGILVASRPGELPVRLFGQARLDHVLHNLATQRHASPSPLQPDSEYGRSFSPSPEAGASGYATPETGGPAGGSHEDAKRQAMRELQRQIAVLHNAQQTGTTARMCAACRAITTMMGENPKVKQWFLAESGTIAIMEMLRQDEQQLLSAALDLLWAVVQGDTATLEGVCLLGMVPLLGNLTGPGSGPEVRLAAANIVEQLCNGTAHTVQVFVACGGLAVLAQLLRNDYTTHSYLVDASLRSIWSILQTQGKLTTMNYIRLLCSSGFIPALLTALTAIIKSIQTHTVAMRAASGGHRIASIGSIGSLGSNNHRSQQASGGEGDWSVGGSRGGGVEEAGSLAAMEARLADICDLIVVLGGCDSVVKTTCSHSPNLKMLVVAMDKLPATLLAKLLNALESFSTDPQAVQVMHSAAAVEMLVAFLKRGETEGGVVLTEELKLPLVQALHNLCKFNKDRQAEAAAAGITPLLMRMSSGHRPGLDPEGEDAGEAVARLRALSIGILCMLAHCNTRTRAELWTNHVLGTFLELLSDSEWQRQVLDAIAVWFVEDTTKLEPKMTFQKNINTMVRVFKAAGRTEERNLNRLKEMLNMSRKLCVKFGVQAEFTDMLMKKLSTANAFLATTILEIVQLLYKWHERPKEFILKHKLMSHLETAKRKHSGAIRVVDKCKSLMQAIQVNEVL